MRNWYVKRLSHRQYHVTCKHLQTGVEEDCGKTLPGCTLDELYTWLATHTRAGDGLIVNDQKELRS